MGTHSTYYAERHKFFHYGHFRRPLGVTQSDNGASKKSIGNEPKIHLCGVIPNKLKHGGFGHRPSLQEGWFNLVFLSCVWVAYLHLDHSEFQLAFPCCLSPRTVFHPAAVFRVIPSPSP